MHSVWVVTSRAEVRDETWTVWRMPRSNSPPALESMGAVSYVADAYGVGCDGVVSSEDCDGGREMREYGNVEILKAWEYGDVEMWLRGYVAHVGI